MDSLNDEQKVIFQKYINGENIFLTGPGGSGKSFLIKSIVQHGEKEELENYEKELEKYKNEEVEIKKPKKKIQVCALTGCASILLNCKATTIHRFAGIGLANKAIDDVVEFVFSKKQRYKLKKWFTIKCLIIDEVSMLSLKLLLILDKIARRVYNKPNLAFGGLQVIFSGDFYQLPPIKSNDEEKEASMFCFEHELWNQIFPLENQIILKTIFRQDEVEFLKVLKYVREGRITHSTKTTLEKRVFNNSQLQEIRKEKVVTIITPFKKDTDYINQKSYNQLNTEEIEYKYNIKACSSKKNTELSDNLLQLTIDSNSSLKQDYEFLENNIMAEKQLKLRKGTHVMCIANIALECKNQIANGSQGIIVDFDEEFPVVKFNNIDVPIKIDRHVWTHETNKNVSVSQIPLIYAWAITIHKAQGVTLDAAIMDIGKNIFEYGQTYVALSRVRTLSGLYLSSFDYSKISANPKVKEFYKCLNV